MKKKRRVLIKNKTAGYILAGSLLLFLVMGITTYYKISDLMIDHSKQSSMSLAQTIAAEIDGDVMAAVTSNDSPEYKEVLDLLSKYRDYAYIKYIYTMRLDENAVLRFIVDADTDDPVACNTEYEWIEDMRPAFEGQVSCDERVTSDEWGSYYSAYAPVFDKNKNVVGIVGVDVSIDDINAYLSKLLRTLIIIFSGTAFVAVVLFLLFSAELTGWDSLTGLMNYEMLVKTGNRLRKNGELEKYTAILVNVKGFKYINRQFGYDFGNEMLKELSEYLKAGLDRMEIISRTGNDNFCLLLLNEHTNDFVDRLKRSNPASVEKAVAGQLPVPVRCGVYKIGKDDSIEQVMGICTVVMNAARKGRGSDIVFYNKEMYESILQEGDILTEYKKAIRNGEFKVYYQPKVDIINNTLCGAEALVRWQRDGKVISPGLFIPLLENEGLITELDFYVFETVCNDIRLWKSQGIKPVPISSNFSKVHLSDPEFANKVVSTADKWSTDHDYLEVEMTESSGYQNIDALNEFIESMSETGIRVDMDDFGTGYSSLSLLGDVAMNTIKIDKSFVDRIFGEKENGAKLVQNVIRMIHDLDRDIICEGVETVEQVEFLKKTECRRVQGYFFDKPLEHDEFTERLKEPVYANV
ncbi:MAG: EAL domain-containing protein [Lachnospiraceae bacterium]|nr:EAL domain-containing protein [Lachnospiraceae bacterium]